VFLAFGSAGDNKSSRIRLADLRLEAPPVLALPQGFREIGKIPARVERLAMDSLANRFAVAVPHLGVGVFDLDAGAFSGWLPIPQTPEEKAAEIHWMGFAGDRLVLADTRDMLWLVSVTRHTIRPLGTIEGFQESFQNLRAAFSPAGDFIALAGKMAGTRLFHIPEEGEMKMRLMETPRIHQLSFSRDGSLLQMITGSDPCHLPLKDWENATLQAAPKPEPQPVHPAPVTDLYSMHEALRDTAQDVYFYVSPTLDLEIKTSHLNRRVTLPSGIIALDRKGEPFFLSADGIVIRIQTAEIPGFNPVRE